MSQNGAGYIGMQRAYRTAGRVLRNRLGATRPEDEAELRRIEPAEVVVVDGEYDRIGLVLEATRVPFLRLSPAQLPGADWERMQVLMINCPGKLPTAALDRIQPWVRAGGYLVTTDWALKYVVEPLFPGRVRHNGKTTTDCVVRVEGEAASQDPLLAGFLESGRDPLWWLEQASYPVEVLDTVRVRVLARSREVGEKWGTDAIVVTFDEEAGTVLHLVSHLFLQRSDVREARDAAPAPTFLSAQFGLAVSEAEAMLPDAGDMTAGELAGAFSTADLVSKVILSRRRGPAKGGSR